MRVVDEQIVYRNPYPNHRPEVVGGSTLAWSRVGVSGATDAPVLLNAFRSGSAKMSPDGRVKMRGSADLGRTWHDVRSPFAMLPHDPITSESGPHLGSSSSGTTVFMACRMWIVSPGDPGWNDDAAGVIGADCLATRADADGIWDTPASYDFRRHAREWAIPCGPPLALNGGRGPDWIFPMERHALASEAEWLRRYHAFAVFSHDDGRNWGEPTPTLNDPDERVVYYDQRMVELPDGRLLTMAWVHDVVADVTLTSRAGYSSDGGRTWLEPFDTGLQGGPINPLVLADGRIIAVFARRTTPNGIRAALSEDGGATWLLDRELVLWDEATRRVTGEVLPDVDRAPSDPSLWGTMWGWTFGTPTAAQAPDGSVLVTFFGTGFDGVAAIRCVRIEL
jgi:hypothetical protein